MSMRAKSKSFRKAVGPAPTAAGIAIRECLSDAVLLVVYNPEDHQVEQVAAKAPEQPHPQRCVRQALSDSYGCSSRGRPHGLAEGRALGTHRHRGCRKSVLEFGLWQPSGLSAMGLTGPKVRANLGGCREAAKGESGSFLEAAWVPARLKATRASLLHPIPIPVLRDSHPAGAPSPRLSGRPRPRR